MSVGLSITFKDFAKPAVRGLSAAFEPAAINAVVGQAAAKTYQQHFIGLERTRANAIGGRRTNFYGKAAKATNFAVVPDGVVISVNQTGIAQRFYGGKIVPKAGKKFLTIPAIPAAHGHTAADFDLELVYGLNGEPYALARPDYRARDQAASGQRPSRGLLKKKREIVFWLEKSVTQKADPTVLPYDDLVLRDVGRAVDSYTKRNWKGLSPATGGDN